MEEFFAHVIVKTFPHFDALLWTLFSLIYYKLSRKKQSKQTTISSQETNRFTALTVDNLMWSDVVFNSFKY